MNAQKSCIYFAGVSRAVVEEIVSVSGMSVGHLPFKYLGVPITSGRLRKADCACLVDKIVARIRGLGAKHLSYSGRLVLIKSVLSTLHSYWGSLFVLPKCVIQRVGAICRNFLWAGSSEYHRVPLLAWEKVCIPMQAGGLGLKVAEVWNYALVGKLVWWLATRPDKLWVQWIDHVYLKGISWREYCPCSQASWFWKKICSVKVMLDSGIVNGTWLGGLEYSVKGAYKWLQGNQPSCEWSKWLWCNMAVPKHQFMGWLILQEALPLKSRLVKYHVVADELCCICRMAAEDRRHVFWECDYARQIIGGVQKWVKCELIDPGAVQQLMRRRWSRLRKNVMAMIHLTMWYNIWRQRNEAWVALMVQRPEHVVSAIRNSVASRLTVCNVDKLRDSDRDWLRRLDLM